MLEFEFSSHGAGMIHAYRWEPEGQPRGVVQIIHGIAGMCRAMPGLRPSSMPAVFSRHGRGPHGPRQVSRHGALPFSGGWCAAVDDSMELLRRTQGTIPACRISCWATPWAHFDAHAAVSLSGRRAARRRHLRHGLAACPGACGGPCPVRAGKAAPRRDRRSKLLANLMFGAYNRKFPDARTPNDWICSDPRSLQNTRPTRCAGRTRPSA